jgi:hypothetical protein
MFQEGLYSLIVNTPAITALLGTARSDEEDGLFYILAIPEPSMPYITYQRLSGVPQTFSFEGANALQDARFRFSCYGASQRSAVLLAQQLKLLFATWIGTLSEGTVVQQVMQVFEADDTESIPHGTIYACHVDFDFKYIDSESIGSPV